MSIAEERGTVFLGLLEVSLLHPAGAPRQDFNQLFPVQVDAFSKALLHLIMTVFHATNLINVL